MRENRARLERLTRRSVVLASNTALGWAIVGAQKVMGLAYPTLVARSIDAAAGGSVLPRVHCADSPLARSDFREACDGRRDLIGAPAG
jgi:hypothetical protein